jgi:outer membrane protein OmpA-like peptidoglycan-associated protein
MMLESVSAQNYAGYRFLRRVRGIKLTDSKIVEIQLYEDSNNLVATYRERKNLFIAFTKLGSWDKVNEFRIMDNAYLHASYFSEDGKSFFLNTDMYKLVYLKIDMEKGITDTLQCAQTPRGCSSVDQKMPATEVKSKNGYFIYVRDEAHPNDILVYMDNIQFENVRKAMEEALKREVVIREVKEKLENDARKTQGPLPKTATRTTDTDEEPKTATAAPAAKPVPAKPLPSYQITQEDILTLMNTGRFEKGGISMSLSPGLKVKVDNSTVSSLSKPSATYKSGDIIKLDNIEFAQGKSELSPSSYPELDKLVALLKSKPTLQIQINGHTNNVGTHNMKISEERAKSVMDYIIGKGIPPTRLRHRGFGDTQPIASNETEEGLARNRRVEIEIIQQ